MPKSKQNPQIQTYHQRKSEWCSHELNPKKQKKSIQIQGNGIRRRPVPPRPPLLLREGPRLRGAHPVRGELGPAEDPEGGGGEAGPPEERVQEAGQGGPQGFHRGGGADAPRQAPPRPGPPGGYPGRQRRAQASQGRGRQAPGPRDPGGPTAAPPHPLEGKGGEAGDVEDGGKQEDREKQGEGGAASPPEFPLD